MELHAGVAAFKCLVVGHERMHAAVRKVDAPGEEMEEEKSILTANPLAIFV